MTRSSIRSLVRNRSRSLPRLVAAAILASVAIAGCFATDQHPVIRFTNRTDLEVTVFYRNPRGEEQILASGIGPDEGGQSSLFPTTHCTPGELIARDTSGRNVATFSGPICRPSTWILQTP
jgi:hypothetical protein